MLHGILSQHHLVVGPRCVITTTNAGQLLTTIFGIIIVAAAAITPSHAINAIEIPRVQTPGPGLWPQSNVKGCGFNSAPIVNVLENCTEPLDDKAIDLRGYWKNTLTGRITEKI